jgi:hypothetical protein
MIHHTPYMIHHTPSTIHPLTHAPSYAGKTNPFAKPSITASAKKSLGKSLHRGDLNECARALQQEKVLWLLIEGAINR